MILTRAGRATVSVRRTLHKPAWHIPRLNQEKQADLRDVSAGRDVDEIVFRIRVKGVAACELKESLIDLFEVPWVAKLDRMQTDFGLRRNGLDVTLALCSRDANLVCRATVRNGEQSGQAACRAKP